MWRVQEKCVHCMKIRLQCVKKKNKKGRVKSKFRNVRPTSHRKRQNKLIKNKVKM